MLEPLSPEELDKELAGIEKRRDWVKKNYGTSQDRGKRFGYDSLPDTPLLVESCVKNYVRLGSGLWIPEHLHMDTDEWFEVLSGEAIFYTISGKSLEKGFFDNNHLIKPEYISRIIEPSGKKATTYKKGDTFRLEPKEIHSAYNTRNSQPFYLRRIALHKKKGDSYYIEKVIPL